MTTRRPKRKSARSTHKKPERSNNERAAMAICMSVYSSSQCVCSRSDKPVCERMCGAARAAQHIIAPEQEQTMPRRNEDDDDNPALDKAERAKLVASPWAVERHDNESGTIAYEIWCLTPYWRICVIDDELNQHAKLCADRIVEAHNADITRRSILGEKAK